MGLLQLGLRILGVFLFRVERFIESKNSSNFFDSSPRSILDITDEVQEQKLRKALQCEHFCSCFAFNCSQRWRLSFWRCSSSLWAWMAAWLMRTSRRKSRNLLRFKMASLHFKRFIHCDKFWHPSIWLLMIEVCDEEVLLMHISPSLKSIVKCNKMVSLPEEISRIQFAKCRPTKSSKKFSGFDGDEVFFLLVLGSSNFSKMATGLACKSFIGWVISVFLGKNVFSRRDA